ncbi:MAG: serine hydrolase domain-containing protein [Phormidesmis sp.]
MGEYFFRFLRMVTAYKAKLLCSGIFVSGRDAEELLNSDLAVDGLWPLRFLRAVVDVDQRTVRVSFLGGFESVAVYRAGLGSTLVVESTVERLKQQSLCFQKAFVQEKARESFCEQGLSVADEVPCYVDGVRLQRAVDDAFVETNRRRLKRTRAVVVIHKGEIVAERYAAGFSAQLPLLGWSMAKSVVSALVGILVKQGKLALDSKDLLAEWREQPDDPRRAITVDHLLRMSSGLVFSEDYSSPLSDVTTMLFQRGDGAAYAAQLPLQHELGSAFCYAGGTTVLLCRIIREAVGKALVDYWDFAQRELFERLGMMSAVLEPDAAGTFVGSAFMYATARDWGKLGLLYLQDGCWEVNGKWERILPVGWVRYSTAASETADFYGAHFWRGVPNSFTAKERDDSRWPQGAYLAAGYQGQFMTVVPQHDLVVVRMGLSQRQHSWDQVGFIASVRRCFSNT